MDRLTNSVFEIYDSPEAELEHNSRLGLHRWYVQEARWKSETTATSNTHTHTHLRSRIPALVPGLLGIWAAKRVEFPFNSKSNRVRGVFVSCGKYGHCSPLSFWPPALLSSRFFYQWQEQTVIWRDDIPLIPPSLSLSLACVLHMWHAQLH